MTKTYKDLKSNNYEQYEQDKNTNLKKMMIHENGEELRIPWEDLVSKVEYLFSTCTQKVKNRMLTQETLERDQEINRREKRVSCFIEEERGRLLEVPSTSIYTSW